MGLTFSTELFFHFKNKAIRIVRDSCLLCRITLILRTYVLKLELQTNKLHCQRSVSALLFHAFNTHLYF